MMGIPAKQLLRIPHLAEALRAQGIARPRVRSVEAPPMNGLELEYAKHLRLRVAAGEVAWWGFNTIRLRIAAGKYPAWFKPDFMVKLADGRTEFHETKGYEGRQASMLRLKIAAGLFPYRFVLVKRDGGSWTFEEFSAEAA